MVVLVSYILLGGQVSYNLTGTFLMLEIFQILSLIASPRFIINSTLSVRNSQ